MKTLMFLLVGAAWLAIPLESYAVVVKERVTPETLSKLPITVTVKSVARDDGVHFTFTIREDPKPSRFYSGHLTIRKDGIPVAKCPVKPLPPKGPATYSFAVNSGYLSDSDFEIFVGVESGGVAEPGGQSYLFNLKAFNDTSGGK